MRIIRANGKGKLDEPREFLIADREKCGAPRTEKIWEPLPASSMAKKDRRLLNQDLRSFYRIENKFIPLLLIKFSIIDLSK